MQRNVQTLVQLRQRQMLLLSDVCGSCFLLAMHLNGDRETRTDIFGDVMPEIYNLYHKHV